RLPRDANGRQDGGVERQEERVREPAPAADAIRHLDVELVLVEDRSLILLARALVALRADLRVPESVAETISVALPHDLCALRASIAPARRRALLTQPADSDSPIARSSWATYSSTAAATTSTPSACQ